ncbi:MAG TPA: HNH endonuclease signature motif containing protein [Acidimicrobiales bacterium]|nr:HNH endonuclease signature motif containing protein [Acidimicrobiales bacterium]
MLREDKNAGFYWERRLLLFRRHYFTATGLDDCRVGRGRLAELTRLQAEAPSPVTSVGRRTWWWFEDRFFWEDEGYSADDVLALVRERQRRARRQLDKARDLLLMERSPRAPTRAAIPREVRRAVFARDGGCCVECGSTFDLQYDHLLPVALGGATTEENLQILCAECNRSKSDRL